MSNLKIYTAKKLTKGGTVRTDEKLFVAIMTEAMKHGFDSYADFVRSVLAAVCLDKTYGDITGQLKLVTGQKFYTESDMMVLKSQVDTLKDELAEQQTETRLSKDSLQKSQEKHQSEIQRLTNELHHYKGLTQQNQLQGGELLQSESFSQPVYANQPLSANEPVYANQPTSHIQPLAFDPSGIELSEHGKFQPVPANVPVDLDEIIQDNFLKVVGNQMVVEFFSQQEKLNQSFGISGFNGTFKTVEEIPNSLLEHHQLVIYWKKRVGQFENAIVNATEAFFEKDKTVQKMTQQEQMALMALMKREQMLWWLITHFTTIRGFDAKYFSYLTDTVRAFCEGFPVMANPYHENILNAQRQQYGEQ